MGKFHDVCSRPFDVHKWSDFQAAGHAVWMVTEEIIQLRKSKGDRIRNEQRLRNNVKTILLDLYAAAAGEECYYKGRTVPMWIGIPRGKAAYAIGTRYHKLHLSYRRTTSILDDLRELGYIRAYDGFYDRRSGIGRVSRYRARRSLLDRFDLFEAIPSMISGADDQLIVLKDCDKKTIEFTDTEQIVLWRSNLETINSAIAKRTIRLHVPDDEIRKLSERMQADRDREPLNFNRIRLRRVFNDSRLDHGGRFYGGWWQNLPREYRPYIEIDYKATTELDYSGLHVRMLYAKKGLDAPTDPYNLAGFDRDHQKKAMIILLNAPSRDSAIKGARSDGIPNASTLVDAMTGHHGAISEYFFTGVGVKLQFVDSCIAEDVMLGMIKLGGIALPVHDSFIVRIGRENELYEQMEIAFAKHLAGQSVALKAKETVLEIDSRQRKEQGRSPVATWSLFELYEEHQKFKKYNKD